MILNTGTGAFVEHSDPVLDALYAHVHLVGRALEFKERRLTPLLQQKTRA
jgi:hypothetical protein